MREGSGCGSIDQDRSGSYLYLVWDGKSGKLNILESLFSILVFLCY